MSNMPLTDSELQAIIDNMSDMEYEYESDIDDSVCDPDYENIDSLESTDSELGLEYLEKQRFLEREVNLSENDEISDSERTIIEVMMDHMKFMLSGMIVQHSVSLAHDLLDRKTHLIGTLRKNRKHNPKPVTDAKLEKGAMIARESNTHVVVGKWKDKREVLFLTTEAVPEMKDVQTKRGVTRKPSTIAKYNSIKSFIDVSDQKASYSTTVRRGIKWYRKVAIELLTNTAVVNAHIAYQSVTNKTINITKFREEITNKIFNERHNVINASSEETSRSHKFVEINSRGRCTRCYKINSERNGRGYAVANTPRIKTHCNGCEYKFLCMNCFLSLTTAVYENRKCGQIDT
nr:unnamed protein product [Callosobruchus chinensis]